MHRFLIRLSDVLFAGIGLLIAFPLFTAISASILISSGWPVFYRQRRVGKGGREFMLLKFRTMRNHADRSGQLTIGGRDSRITAIGYWLRSYKLDELPQLLHVLSGTMSLVGPRPEVPRYVHLYTPEQRLVLGVRPGITDEASLFYFDESETLEQVEDPERHYIDVILPDKIRLNLPFVLDPNISHYYRTIFRTLARVAGKK